MAVLTKNTKYPAGLNGLQDGAVTVAATSLDTGTILGTVPPGKAGLKLTDGTQQSATYNTVVADGNGTDLKNFYGPSQNAQGQLVQNTTFQGQPKGYSLGLE